ncbi:MAG: carboxypeptidase M32 [Chloroflexi bacterium]|nr:carboxypeptidase M32 [Chloroflexota bacterium]
MFLPELKKNFELTKRTADILMKIKKTNSPYDALLDIYEPGITADHISGLFNELRIGLLVLLDKIKHSPQQPDLSILDRKIPSGVQKTIAFALAKAIGYDVVSSNAGGRIDETEHPFTSGYYSDVRITTHYNEKRFTSSVFSVLHEAGHALYEQFQNPEWLYQPVGSACSTGFHESQSRMIENMIGRSYEFWNCFLPELQVIAGDSLKDIELEKYVHAINYVQPSTIRIEADEVTYSLHVIIRFNLEKALFDNKISVEEMPEFWNKSYRDYLGMDIPNYSEGILQDVHWAGGMFGYFPCYALGNIYSGQLLAQMNLDIPQWPEELGKGNFTPVKNWMTDKIHRQGNLYDPPVLIKRITGQELTVKPFINYLNRKYSGLYGL